LVPALEPLAQAVAWVPWLCLAYTNAVVRWLAGWPAASVPVGAAGLAWLAAAYGLLGGGLGLGAWRRRGGKLPRLPVPGGAARALQGAGRTLLGLGLAGAVLAWLAVIQLPDGKLHVAFLDVGQGDGILITTPQGQQILVDGGPSPAALTSTLGREMPFWDHSLDLVALTHPDADHLTGLLPVLARYRTGGWLDNGRPGGDALYAECEGLLAAAEVPRRTVRAGARLDLGEGVVLEVLHPPEVLLYGTASDSNNNSLVLRLAWGEASFLLTGDVEAEAEALLLREGAVEPATVLKVGHHGSDGGSTAAWLAAVAPRYAVISVGEDNRFEHPHEEVLARLAAQGAVVLRTDQVGTVEFVTDGQQMWVRTER
jgi:competence protein ComEC